ncbi:MAG: hypothetical protein A2452_05705 [Candidatus Firestonebacteria bacterium RIFOXYC2_FULL_39_67]|nr:MAG: hypothetical protein A2536_11780 [Candidatus Firestonebacteria bacterium RIFOXYD2_FULL_39_29]OGF56570.1 MAG: hypothetical protein A2452_05705 [Candidatus Firestonebacteria bacterium RIFOXYC2_FULL_39_67]OGF58065.1 MAG: hypothetical protein A2497_05535 [Candidatus Firestonebacteria bacterium RifOxyC12_full_39_7]
MIQEFLSSPGKIWTYLREHGESSVYKMKKDLSMTDSMLYIGIGWLAKEGKLDIRRDDGSLKVRLIQ